MLKADKIELVILGEFFDPDKDERYLRLTDLQALIAKKLEANASPSEIRSVLLLLHENRCIQFGSKTSATFVQFDPATDDDYFDSGYFHCRRLPRAFRRYQELNTTDKQGIFISHIKEEGPVALRLKKLLQTALAPSVPVFVSCDYESIPSGTPWWNTILDGIRRSRCIIVLLSAASVERRWINFEAGFGLGQDMRVLPLVWRGLRKDDVGMPLGELQVRELLDPDEFSALLTTVAGICGLKLDDSLIGDFLQDLPVLENQVPTSQLRVNVFRDGQALSMVIQNIGNRPLDMIDAEILVPQQLCRNTFLTSYEPLSERINLEEDGVAFVGLRLTTRPFGRPDLGLNPLRETLMPGTEPLSLNAIGIAFPHPLSDEDLLLPVRFRVSARQASVGPLKLPLRDLSPSRS